LQAVDPTREEQQQKEQDEYVSDMGSEPDPNSRSSSSHSRATFHWY